MSATPQEIFERYIWSGMTRNATALAEMFTVDGVLEAPLVPVGRAFPRRLEGREEIREAMAAYYERSAGADLSVNVEGSRYVLHATADPEVFIAEIDTALDGPGGATVMSLVQIFRLRDGKIAQLRDYFAPDQVD
ncbi:nuclear transport factor 2 family protein [Streptosporangium sp. NPDC003464]